jgi:hypothetical protein
MGGVVIAGTHWSMSQGCARVFDSHASLDCSFLANLISLEDRFWFTVCRRTCGLRKRLICKYLIALKFALGATCCARALRRMPRSDRGGCLRLARCRCRRLSELAVAPRTRPPVNFCRCCDRACSSHCWPSGASSTGIRSAVSHEPSCRCLPCPPKAASRARGCALEGSLLGSIPRLVS